MMQLSIRRGTRLLGGAVLGLMLVAPGAGALPAGAAPAAQQLPPGLPTSPVPDPHQPGVQYFAATGHTLRGSFLTYWTNNGGLAQFGYPITEEFAESNGPTDQKPAVVQYFQRNRFEHHPENADPQYQVLIGALGSVFHKPDPPVPAQANPTAEYFSQTGHNLNGAFKAYWHSHGGLPIYGYPITEAIGEQNAINGQKYTVQYFERARFELHPENAGTPYEVLLGLLGTQLARQKGYFGPTGSYAALGHAPDFSWVAGQIAITRIQGGCVFVRYDGGASVQPVGQAWADAQGAGLVAQDKYVVLFGHLAGPGEPVPVCPARGYVVDRVQANAGP